MILYVKKTLKYEVIDSIHDHDIQSIWIKGGFENSKQLYFCHFYREYTSTLGSSISKQRQYLEKLLNQWELVCSHQNQNEVHFMGDMNIDFLKNKWLTPGYHLISLSRMLKITCDAFNLSQLVLEPTASCLTVLKIGRVFHA